MDASTQERAIKGLIALWEDIYFVQGKDYVASRLKPGIQDALKEIGPLFFSLAEGFAEYNNYPLELRRDLIRKDLEQKPNQLLVSFLKRWLYYTARGCNKIERTEAEMEQLSTALSVWRGIKQKKGEHFYSPSLFLSQSRLTTVRT